MRVVRCPRLQAWSYGGRRHALYPRACSLLATSHLNLGAIICLADGERKQVKSVSGQNRIARCEMIEADPPVTNPDHTRRHVIGDVGLCPKLSPLIVNLDRITVGVGRCRATGPNIARIASLIEDESLMRASETGSPCSPLL